MAIIITNFVNEHFGRIVDVVESTINKLDDKLSKAITAEYSNNTLNITKLGQEVISE